MNNVEPISAVWRQKRDCFVGASQAAEDSVKHLEDSEDVVTDFLDVAAVWADDIVGESLDVLNELLKEAGAEFQVDNPECVPLEQSLGREQSHGRLLGRVDVPSHQNVHLSKDTYMVKCCTDKATIVLQAAPRRF